MSLTTIRPSSPLSRLRLYTLQQDMVRPRKFKPRKTPKMDIYRKRGGPDYTDVAYREAVMKLKYLLAESYAPLAIHKAPSFSMTPTKDTSKTTMYPMEYRAKPPEDTSPYQMKQDEYIHQLEKEGQMYREELSRMLDKVRQVVDKAPETEEEESEKDIKPRKGPSIVYSSRISELEAQLTQCKLELRKAQDEASYMKAHSKPIQPPVSQQTVAQMEILQRERDELNDRVVSLQTLVGQLRDKEASATQKVKRSLDVVDQVHFDKNQLEMEVRRLKSEVERMNDKQREALQESARRVSDAERRYAMQIERLNNDLAAQWDAANRLNLELDRARRTEAELRRDLAQKNATIEELKKELTTKTGNLQNEALTAGAERESLEAELAACRLSVERAERNGRQETARLQAEVQALRGRLDRADQDLLHSRKENIRLNDVVAGLERELSLAKITKDSVTSKDSKRTDELTSMIKEMDAKHELSVSELEGLIQSQTQLMEKLNAECQALTRRLEDSSARHKEEMASLQNNIEYLSNKLEVPQHEKQDWRDDEMLGKIQFDEKKNREIERNEIGDYRSNVVNDKNNKDNVLSGLVKNGERTGTEGNDYKLQKQKSREEETKSRQYDKKFDESPPLQKREVSEPKENDRPERKYSQGKIPDVQNNKQEEIIDQTENQKEKEQYRQSEFHDQGGTEQYQQEVYSQGGTEQYQKDGVYEQSDTEQYQEGGTEQYQREVYGQGGTEQYQKDGMYEQSNTEQYQQGEVYDKGATEQYQGEVYDQSGTEQYQQGDDYVQGGTEHYQQEVYGQGGTEQYQQEEVYQQEGNEAYQKGAYDETANAEYQPGQEYDPTAAEQYQQGDAYDQQYGQDYDSQNYTQPGAETYEEHGYDPSVQYEEGQGYSEQNTGQYEQTEQYEAYPEGVTQEYPTQDTDSTAHQGYQGTS